MFSEQSASIVTSDEKLKKQNKTHKKPNKQLKQKQQKQKQQKQKNQKQQKQKQQKQKQQKQ